MGDLQISIGIFSHLVLAVVVLGVLSTQTRSLTPVGAVLLSCSVFGVIYFWVAVAS